MFGKLYHTAAVVSIALVLAGGGLVGLLYANGQLTAERVDAIAAVLRGTPVEAGEAVVVDAAEEPNEAGSPERAASAEEIRQQRREAQLHRALNERAARDCVAQRRLLEQAMQHLLTTEEQFERDRKEWEAELERRRGAARDEGFEKELRIVSKLSPKLAKEHVVRKWKESPDDAVRMLNALPESTSKRILGQMKTPEEMQITHELLERLSREEVQQFEP